jgi:hypothetical protein
MEEMKKMYKTTALAAGMICMLAGTSAFAGGASDMEMIKRQVQELISQNQTLTKRIGELESGQAVQSGAGNDARVSEEARTNHRSVIEEEIAKQLSEKGGQSINDYVSLSGVIEGEFATGDDFEGNNFNEFVLATVELGLDVEVNDWVRGSVLALYEGGEEDEHIVIDEGFVEIGNYDKFPLSVAVGKIYVPFGNFETNMIQDPFTLELGEISDFGMNVGFEAVGLYGGVFAYNGMKKDGGSDVIKGYGAQLGYAFENDSMGIDAGFSYVGNIADSGGISGFLNDDLGKDTVRDQVGGLGAHVVATFGPAMIVAEYVTALDSFNDENAEDPMDVYGAEPSAWNLEFGYGVDLGDIPANFAIGMQGTDESVELGLPETRYIAAASFEIFPATALTFEYFYDNDYDQSDGGTGENANTFTTQLAYEF